MSAVVMRAFCDRVAALDALLVARALEDAVHEDARRVDVVGIELADLDELLDLGDGDLAPRWPSSG